MPTEITDSVKPIDDAHVPVSKSRKVFQPFVPADAWLSEFTLRAVLVGSVLGLLFGAASMYVSLKTGLTVSASIPIAVMSISIFRALGKTSILENNISQTTGSAGESIAGGISFTIPGLLVLGYDLQIAPTTIIALLGGWLGILLMIPLRRALIVKEHETLIYPEGTACAEVLVVGEKGGTEAKTVFTGLGIAFVYRLLMSGARLWNEAPSYIFKNYQGATVSVGISPELLGVGYIIGTRIASMMLGGAVLSALVLIPLIKLFGAGFTTPFFPAQPNGKIISAMAAGEIQDLYIRYIAAGAVAAGGIISLIRALPSIIGAFKASVGSFGENKSAGDAAKTARTDRDIPMSFVIGGIGVLAMAIFIWLSSAGENGFFISLVSVVLILVLGFFFATVSSRITGEMGSSANPISGMTIAAILLTSLVFLLLGKGGVDSRVLALSVGAIVCVAVSNAGTTSQDLKTGFLVGGTPSKMQWGLMVGVTASAMVVAWTMTFLNDSYSNLLPRYYPSYRVQIDPTHDEEWKKGDLRGKEPAGGKYLIHRLPVDDKSADGTIIPSGQYLVDSAGEIHYQLNPGINGVRTALSDQKLPTGPMAVSAENTKLVRGLDDRLYRSVKITDGENARTFYVDEGGIARFEEVQTTADSKFDAPKGQLMAILVDGVLTRKLPWSLILIGVFISVLLEIIGISALPFAVGMYLPFSTSATIFVGGVVRSAVSRMMCGRRSATDEESGPGVLYSSGLIAGSAVAGLLIAVPQGLGADKTIDLVQYLPGWFAETNLTAILMFGVLIATLYYIARHGLSSGKGK